jgi:hypothetical protein
MFCRACWDVYNADRVTEEMKIKERRGLLAEGFCNNQHCACCRPSFDGRYCGREVAKGSERCKNCK